MGLGHLLIEDETSTTLYTKFSLSLISAAPTVRPRIRLLLPLNTMKQRHNVREGGWAYTDHV